MATPVVVTYKPSFTFGFEEHFDPDAFLEWMRIHWTDSFIYAAIYVMVIFSIKHYMKDREKFDLRLALAMWSGVLAVFSIMGALRTIPEMIYGLTNHGLEYTVCNPSYFYGQTSFWAYMFVISKVYELGDTLFIVFRKTPLIFLHWYHHISVMIYVWYSYTDHTAPGRWFEVMNYTVHSVMYTYYTLRALRIRVPKAVSMCITTMQITQMVVGIFINYISYRVKGRGDFCQQSYENLRYCSIMYASYFLLFSYFFYNAYFKPKSALPVAGTTTIARESMKPSGMDGVTHINNHKVEKKRQ